jgi:hypothetical protein
MTQAIAQIHVVLLVKSFDSASAVVRRFRRRDVELIAWIARSV